MDNEKQLRVRVLSTTHWTGPDSSGLQRLEAGRVLDVDHDTARRWKRNGIAEDAPDAPLGVVRDEDLNKSAADFDAEIARLQALRNAAATRAQEQAAALPEDDDVQRTDYGDGLARYDLTEAQKTEMRRAGFTDPDRIAAARDDELLQVPGIGQATVDKLRGQ